MSQVEEHELSNNVTDRTVPRKPQAGCAVLPAPFRRPKRRLIRHARNEAGPMTAPVIPRRSDHVKVDGNFLPMQPPADQPLQARSADVHAVITMALKAAGLWKPP